MSRIGDKIKQARLSSKMNEKQLAKKIGVSERFVKDVEMGRKVINENLIKKISKILGKDLNDITMSFEEQIFEEEKQNKSQKKQTIEKVKDVWNDAFGAILKTVPIYGYDMSKTLSTRKMPIIDNKVEGYGKEKVLFLQIQDDEMIGFRMSKGDIAFGHITHEVENNAICLIESKGERVIRQVKRLDNSKLLLISNRGSLRTETVGIKDIKVLVRIDKIEIKL
ncbi:helix-turn-helix transcriptional regulator [Clostridium aestuarii]|uniref:Helix-turn-helix transcriptional regulator n=1 Tax=Clostridium aestuarii TaxID=338193 RepID=A0ABT4D443_9CLOT|nr:helix-turn-helix transcriptional regulator [Clostridium aestuarii]MCY6484975.1 helix-turn-helix transcriptional regulator [Clostridium aestuarii]